MICFAYGSNLFPPRLLARAPSARFLGPARLAGHVLRFHKRGADGSGKADAFATGEAADEVWGALFEMSDAERVALDAVEGGYEGSMLNVGEGVAYVYRARADCVDERLRPYPWYLDYVRFGARSQRLPERYCDRIDTVPVTADPDRQRVARHRAVLAAGARPNADGSAL